MNSSYVQIKPRAWFCFYKSDKLLEYQNGEGAGPSCGLNPSFSNRERKRTFQVTLWWDSESTSSKTSAFYLLIRFLSHFERTNWVYKVIKISNWIGGSTYFKYIFNALLHFSKHRHCLAECGIIAIATWNLGLIFKGRSSQENPVLRKWELSIHLSHSPSSQNHLLSALVPDAVDT